MSSGSWLRSCAHLAKPCHLAVLWWLENKGLCCVHFESATTHGNQLLYFTYLPPVCTKLVAMGLWSLYIVIAVCTLLFNYPTCCRGFIWENCEPFERIFFLYTGMSLSWDVFAIHCLFGIDCVSCISTASLCLGTCQFLQCTKGMGRRFGCSVMGASVSSYSACNPRRRTWLKGAAREVIWHFASSSNCMIVAMFYKLSSVVFWNCDFF